MKPNETDEIFARRDEIEAPLDPQRYAVLRRLATGSDHRLVVSLGGGSAVGLSANAALVQILEELGLKEQVTQVWGTSAGAIIGGAWVSGTPPREMLRLLRAANGSLDVCWLELVTSLLLRPFGYPLPEGLIRGRKIVALIEQALRVRTFEECTVPFRCISVTDDGEACRTVQQHGPLLPAIYGSMSLPGIFMPYPRADGEPCGYCDGGIVEKTPLRSPISEHLRSGDPAKLLLLATHFSNQGHHVPSRGFIRRFFEAIYALEELSWPYQLAEARAYPNVALVLLDPQIRVANALDLSLVERHYLRAREAFREILQDSRLALALA
jgi:hypothetical protein